MTGDPSEAVREAIRMHREALVRRFGWTDLEVRPDIDADTRTVTLRGRVLAPRFATRVAAVVAAVLPADWRVDAGGLRPEAGGSWHALTQPITALLAAIPGPERAAGLATELLPADGPVLRIAAHEVWTLVRATDGTLGWTDAALGEATPPPRLRAAGPGTADAFVRAATQRVGTPYKLGGTTETGIDCSGLVQRALRSADIGLVPRHSSDQLAIDPRPGPGADACGDLVFVWSKREAPCHVGIADGQARIVHASRTRGVVDDPRDAFVGGAEQVRHVPFSSLHALQSQLQGAAALSDVFELGRAPR